MAVIIADRVKVRSFTNGLGTLTLGPVVPGFQTFEVIGNGNETYYSITSNANEWEVGRGTYTKVGIVETLTRDTIISSSNNNLKVNFTGGGKTVFCTLPSSVAQSFIVGSVSDSFKTIAVAGQSNVVADSSTDTLTLVAGSSNIAITTDATTDTITIDSVPSSLENTTYTVSLETTGSILFPGDITQGATDRTVCSAGVETVIYTATAQYQHAIKLFVMVEGIEDGGGINWETQACDVVAVKGYNNNIVNVSVYGVTNSGAAALATFDGQWNAISNRIEITCTSVSLTYGVEVKVHAIEMATND
jgi:hypothetical protein